MSIYTFPPMPDVHGANVHYAWQDNIFSDEELSILEEVCSHRKFVDGVIRKEQLEEKSLDIRETKIAWIELAEDTHFIYNRLVNYINFLNGKYFQFDLFGYVENLQYTVYGIDGHYTWHIDSISDISVPPRKLSTVLMLSSPEEHKGGDLQVFTGKEPHTLERKKGRLYLFPSYVLHRVTPVTSGTRKTLVSWVSGNKFR
jgi:PKHD-type hydroxylase